MKAETSLRSVLARNLKVALVRRKKSVVAVADFAEVSVAHLYDIIGGRKAATVDIIEKVASALGVPPADLLRPEQPAEPGPKRSPRPTSTATSNASRRAKSSRSRRPV